MPVTSEWMLTVGGRLEVIFVLSCLLGGVCKEEVQDRLLRKGMVARMGEVFASIDWGRVEEGRGEGQGQGESVGQVLRVQVRGMGGEREGG